ncbi:MAG: S24/S26 family peptidase [Alloprevotella sp.]|nr:S24/S26 family peptidase [Alloprevotella sp.]
MKKSPETSPVSTRRITKPNAELIPAIAAFIREGRTPDFIVRGFSMRPFLEHERDKVRIRAVGDRSVKRGDVVLAEIAPATYVIHRVVSNEAGSLTLRGDGNVRGTETCREADVIGIVEGFYRKGRSVMEPVTGRKWRLYSALWPASPLLRRLLLAFHRRIWLPLTHGRAQDILQKNSNTQEKI